MVEILLQNGAEVNAADKVICDEWTDAIQRNACQRVVEIKIKMWEMALTIAGCIEQIVYGQG